MAVSATQEANPTIHYQQQQEAMGEAKRRREAAAAATLPAELVSDFFRGVAEVVDAFKLQTDIGGLCMQKTLIAYQAVRACGLDATIGIGGVLLRVGPDPMRDVLAWCGQRSMGHVMINGAVIFHCWLRYRDLIFDATVGDWRELDMPAMEMATFGKALAPPQWDITLPRYWLKPVAEVEGAWMPTGEPAVGDVWYCPFHGSVDNIKQRLQLLRDIHGERFALGLEDLLDAHATTHGLDHVRRARSDVVFPLKFSVRRM